MNVSALIDAIVRQTTILIAQLATLEGGRAQLAHTANQVFLDLSSALREHGVGSKVIADMFGLALRTYQERVRRLSESRTMRGRSLWEAVLEHIEARGPIVRADVLARFAYDDLAAVRSVLRDLVHNGIVYRTGRGDQTTYRAATADELRAPLQRSSKALGNLVWIAVQRAGSARPKDLMQTLSIDAERLDTALLDLCGRGLIEKRETAEGSVYESHGCVLSYEDPHGWEAAVFDHFQAMVIALCTKLRLGQTHAAPNDTIGGSTFGFEVWPGHPEYENVLGLLSKLRAEGSALRKRVAAHNESHSAPADQKRRVVTYVGQTVIGADSALGPQDVDLDEDDAEPLEP
jgi:hypothetical protein